MSAPRSDGGGSAIRGTDGGERPSLSQVLSTPNGKGRKPLALTQRVFAVLVYQSLALNELGANCADTMEFIGFGLPINRLALNELGANCAATKAFIVFFLIYK